MPVLPIDTERLHLRIMRTTDAPRLAAYRSLPDIARYQDWELPYTVDSALASLAGQEDLVDLEVGQWVSVAIEHDGELVGDVAVGLMHEGRIAYLGYTLAPEHHGHGFATEAAGALVDAVFANTGVHRFVATLDPENYASMRVIEPLGFVLEGTAREAEFIRGEWLDDMRFALLEPERADWLNRPATAPDHVELIEITEHNLRTVMQLATHRFQERFVAPVARSLAQALVPPTAHGSAVVPWYRAIAADGEIVGFVMLAEPSATEPAPYLWRLLIDRRHQRRGIGAIVLAQLVERARAGGHTAMLVSWVDEPGGPRSFYERLGFVPTGEVEDGEIVARLEL